MLSACPLWLMLMFGAVSSASPVPLGIEQDLQDSLANYAQIPPTDTVERYRRALELQPRGGRDAYQRFVVNLVYFCMGSRSPRMQAMGPDVFQSLRKCLKLNNVLVLESTVRLCDDGSPTALAFLHNQVLFPPAGVEKPRLDDVLFVVGQQPGARAAPELITWLIEVHPQEGLIGLGRAFHAEPVVGRELMWSAHYVADVDWRLRFNFEQPGDVDNAVALLSRLSQRDQWWIRYYVATMLLNQPVFREQEIEGRLSKDANTLVREQMMRIEAGRLTETGPEEPYRPPPTIFLPGMGGATSRESQ